MFDPDNTWNALCAAILVAICSYLASFKSFPKSLPVPPGPRPLPIIGNAHQMPSDASWKTFAEWGKSYGKIIYLKAFGNKLIVLNSAKTAHELLDKRSSNFSFRPKFTMANEVIGWKFSLTSMDYSEKSRQQRRYMQSYFRTSKLAEYYSIQMTEAHQLLQDLLDDPEDYRASFKRMAGSVAMMVAYGHHVVANDDPFVVIAEKGVKTIEAVGAVGAHIVDLVPWLRFYPDWLPGSSIKAVPPGTRENLQTFLHTPFQEVKRQMREGSFKPSYVSSLLEVTLGEDDEGVMGTAALIYSGGFDTTYSTLMSAVTLLTAHPIIQARVQAEMDVVVGKDRLPTFDDREKLPYLQAVISETIRFAASTPVGVPHCVGKDDHFEGMYLPAGATVLANQWAMLHDPDVYPNPETFNPDRFLEGEGRVMQMDPRSVAFGFGRRICPGKDFAENTVWAAVASVFYAFHIRPLLDANEQPEEISLVYRENSVRHPMPFKCKIEPRRSRVEALIRQTASDW